MPTFFIDLRGEGARPAKGIGSEILKKKRIKRKTKQKERETVDEQAATPLEPLYLLLRG
jgi:hypothetical protein